jgi:hypothetical protein
MGSMRKVLSRVHSSASLLESLEHASRSDQSLVLQASLAFSEDCDRCLAFLRRCADYAEIMSALCTLPTSLPASSQPGISHDLGRRAMRSRFEAVVVSESAKSVLNAQGLSSYGLTRCDGSHQSHPPVLLLQVRESSRPCTDGPCR